MEMAELIDGIEDQESEIEELRGHYMSKIVTFVTPLTVGQSPEDLEIEVDGFDYEASKRTRSMQEGVLKVMT